MKKSLLLAVMITALLACNRHKYEYDASGTFEATTMLIAAEATGKVLEFNVKEGDWLTTGQRLGAIDSTQLFLRKLQLEQAARAVTQRKPNVALQIAATQEQIAKAEVDRKRIENLLADGAATQKQMDDINAQLAILQKTLAAQRNSLHTSVSSLDEESSVYDIQVEQVNDQLAKCRLINPTEGLVLNKYVEENEMVAPGRALYQLADIRDMILRAYIVSAQLEELKIGQEVTIFLHASKEPYEYKGKIAWISDKAEFTPRTIQTKDERQNLVYAIKINVPNPDGKIKIGMYGDVNF